MKRIMLKLQYNSKHFVDLEAQEVQQIRTWLVLLTDSLWFMNQWYSVVNYICPQTDSQVVV